MLLQAFDGGGRLHRRLSPDGTATDNREHLAGWFNIRQTRVPRRTWCLKGVGANDCRLPTCAATRTGLAPLWSLSREVDPSRFPRRRLHASPRKRRTRGAGFGMVRRRSIEVFSILLAAPSSASKVRLERCRASGSIARNGVSAVTSRKGRASSAVEVRRCCCCPRASPS